MKILETINSPADLRQLNSAELEQLAAEIRQFIVDAVSKTGGHLGSNLGAVELTLAVHRVFDSPKDVVLWDTGHQAYVHKIVTGRKDDFNRLRQEGGLSGYPNRTESEHDWVENSHASTILSYAHGFSTAFDLNGLRSPKGSTHSPSDRRVVAIIGDGALTGGMAYEALNNLGHSGRRVIVILNDNGRSYAPTVSKLSESLSRIRLSPSYVQTRNKVKQIIKDLPAVGGLAYSSVHATLSAVREMVEPHVFFESLGVRYTGPFGGHDVLAMESALRNAAEFDDGPIVVHVLTRKGQGYGPAEEDEVQCLHDLKVSSPTTLSVAPGTSSSNGHADPPSDIASISAKGAIQGNGHGAAVEELPRRSYTEVFTESLLKAAENDPRIVAITAAMPGPTGLLPFQDRYPDRYLDVGIAEQHAVTAAAGMAMAGLRPVVALYSTFFSRAFDQANLDVGMHKLPVTYVFDRAGITGDDGPSHHGVLDMVLNLVIPDVAIFAPSSAQELPLMFEAALELDGPAIIRFSKTLARQVPDDQVGTGMKARKVRSGKDVCILAVGKMAEAAEEAANILEHSGISATVWDVRVVRPADPEMLEDAASHPLIVTAEDGLRTGGAGSYLVDLIAGLSQTRACSPSLILGTPVRFLHHSKPDTILSKLGLDGPGIATSIIQALGAATTKSASANTRVSPAQRKMASAAPSESQGN